MSAGREEARWEVSLAASPEEAFAWHARPGALERLNPPWERVVVDARTGPLGPGTRVGLRAGPWWARTTWVVEHTAFEPGVRFVDRQVSGPFAEWEHEHRFSGVPGGGCVLADAVRYRLPLGALGRAVAGRWVRRRLDRLFAYRHAVTAGDLDFAHPHAPSRPMRIVVAGSSGLVGSVLVPYLATQGHTVVRLVRAPDNRYAFAPQAVWHPESGVMDSAALEGADAVVSLGGSNLAEGRWTRAVKEELRSSRVGPTEVLATAMARQVKPPPVWVSASAVGVYGDRGDAVCDEATPAGRGFLAELCRDWEAATAPAADAGVRVVNLRIGVVLTPAGGALAKLLPVFRAGLGGPAGSGKQWMSWVSPDDVAAAILHAVRRPEVRGPVNAVAPEPVTNAAFGEVLGRVVGRQARLGAPAFALRARFGEMAEATILASTRVVPTRLVATGYRHRHASLEWALREVLGAGGGG